MQNYNYNFGAVDNNHHNQLCRLGIPEHFIQQGTRKELLQEVGLTAENLISIIESKFEKQKVYEL